MELFYAMICNHITQSYVSQDPSNQLINHCPLEWDEPIWTLYTPTNRNKCFFNRIIVMVWTLIKVRYLLPQSTWLLHCYVSDRQKRDEKT